MPVQKHYRVKMFARNNLRLFGHLMLLLLLLAGCARLPTGVPIPAEEQEFVSSSFRQWRSEQLACPSELDAAATVTFRAWFQSGILSGFVQAMEPAHLRFVGLNPLGQPMLVLVTDGQSFRYVSVPEERSYEGSVQARAFARYAPEGLQPEHLFFWLTGRPAPELSEVGSVLRDEATAAYWLELAGEGRLRHRVLFSPRLEMVYRHQVVDERWNILAEVRYDDFQEIAGLADVICRWPGRLTVETREHSGRMIIELNDWLPDPRLHETDFQFQPPVGYERIMVQ
jgi:hypothetical protein